MRDEQICFDKVSAYMAKGMDQRTAEYFAGGQKHIVSVVPNDNFTLTLGFDNGEVRVYDCKPMLEAGGLFSKFSDIDEFRRVYLDEEGCVAWDIDPAVDSREVWSNKIDLCPDSCYMDSIPLEQ